MDAHQHEPRERGVPVGQTKRRHGHQGNALVASRFRFAPDGDTALPGRPGRSRAPGEAPISTNPHVQHEPRERSVPVGQTKRRHGHQGNALVASRFRFAPDGDTALPGRPGRSRAPGEAPISTNPHVQHEPRERSVPVGQTKRRHGHQGSALVASRFRFAPDGDTARPGRPRGPQDAPARAPQYRTATSVSPCGGAVMPASLRGAPSSSARNDSVSRRPRPHSSMVPTSTRTM